MNIALCYSGQLRNFKACFETHKRYIIDSNPKDRFFIFAHFWHDNNLQGIKYRGQIQDDKEKDFWNINNVFDFVAIGPDSFLCQTPINFESSLVPDPRFPHPMQNTLSMFFSIYKANQLQKEFSRERGFNFDISIRMRTDLFFTRNLELDKFDKNKVHIHDQVCHMPYGVNDIFAFGASEEMNEYSSVFGNIYNMANEGCAVNPECFLGYHLNSSGCKFKKTLLHNYYYRVYRDR